MNIDRKKLAIVGLGYVGLPLAIEFGKKRETLGFDISQDRIQDLEKSIDKTLEVGRDEFMLSKHLFFSSSQKDLADCSIYIITVPTPIDSVNRPDLTSIRKASEMVANYLSKGDLVIFESTVYPGCTEEYCVPILEAISGLTYNVDFFCGYSPERINPGDKKNTLTKIKKITSGSNDEVASVVDSLYREIISAGTFKATSIKVAEAAKVIENTQRDLNIALVNELSVIFEKLDIDTLEVLEAAGSKWNFLPFRPGIVGGHCIGVDPYYLTHKAEEVSYHPEVILAGRRINDNMASYVATNLIKRMLSNEIDVSRSKVGILGITFKENCPDIRNSKVIDIINVLKDWNVEVVIYDPLADPLDVADNYGVSLEGLSSFKDLDALVIAVGHKEFRDMEAKELRNLCRGDKPVAIDIKSIYDKELLDKQGFTVFRL